MTWTAEGSNSHDGSGGGPLPADEGSFTDPSVGAVSTHDPVPSGNRPHVSPAAASSGTTNSSTSEPAAPLARWIVSLPQLMPNGNPPATFSTTRSSPGRIVVPAGNR